MLWHHNFHLYIFCNLCYLPLVSSHMHLTLNHIYCLFCLCCLVHYYLEHFFAVQLLLLLLSYLLLLVCSLAFDPIGFLLPSYFLHLLCLHMGLKRILYCLDTSTYYTSLYLIVLVHFVLILLHSFHCYYLLLFHIFLCKSLQMSLLMLSYCYNLLLSILPFLLCFQILVLHYIANHLHHICFLLCCSFSMCIHLRYCLLASLALYNLNFLFLLQYFCMILFHYMYILYFHSNHHILLAILTLVCMFYLLLLPHLLALVLFHHILHLLLVSIHIHYLNYLLILHLLIVVVLLYFLIL